MIPFVDFKGEHSEMKPEIMKKIGKIMKNSQFILGEENTNFEKEFSHYIGKNYGISFNSGSDALFLALKSLNIKRGDEVITVSHTFISTADAIVRNKAKPVFVDIDPETYCMNTNLIEDKITDKTKIIIPVHLYGHPVDMDPIIKIANDYNLFVVEDACQAHGAEYKNKKVGSIGDIGCFSFYPTKNLGCYGDGGIAVTDHDELDEKMKMLRNYGQKQKYYHECIGINSRLDEIQAGILREKLKHLDAWNERRRNIARIYNENLENLEIINPIEKRYAKHVYHLYVIKHKKRDLLKKHLDKARIQYQIHYPIPVHKQNAYSEFNSEELDVTEKICNEIISLPLYPWMKIEDVLNITDVINNALC